LIVPVVLAAAGILIATIPSTRTRTFDDADGTVSVSFRCKAPVLDVLGIGDEGGWFAYAPNTGKTFASGGVSCRPEAYCRTGAGAALLAAAAALVFMRFRPGRVLRRRTQ
jgi:hypothetical protein